MNNSAMNKYERRRLRLMVLRDTKCHGSGADLARKIGCHPSYVTRMLYPEGKAGKKRIADDMMEAIEGAFDLPRGWIDMDVESLVETTAPTVAEVVGSIRPEDQDILAVSALMRTMCASQRSEVLGYARRVAETSQSANKANSAP